MNSNQLKSIIIIFLGWSSSLFSQERFDSSLVSLSKTTYAIPDVPAFQILGGTPSNIMRNSKIKAFSVVTQIYNGREFIIPNSLGIEIAPFKLLNRNKQSLQQYNQSYILNNLGISFGAIKDSNKTFRMSLGARIVLIDKSDPLKNDKFLDKIIHDLPNPEDKAKIRKKFVADNNLSMSDIENDTNIRNRFEVYYKEYIGSEKSIALTEEIKKFQELNWNKERLDLAFSVLGSSQDSLVSNIALSAYSIWGTYAIPIALNVQSIFSANYHANQTLNIQTFSVSNRWYFGTNTIKGFVEGQYAFLSESKQGYLFNLGGEYNIYKTPLWIEFAFGIHENILPNQKSVFNSSFNIKYAVF